MMRPSVQGVDPPVCCVLDVTVTYARDSFVDSQAGPFVLSRGGGGGPRYPGTRLTILSPDKVGGCTNRCPVLGGIFMRVINHFYVTQGALLVSLVGYDTFYSKPVRYRLHLFWL